MYKLIFLLLINEFCRLQGVAMRVNTCNADNHGKPCGRVSCCGGVDKDGNLLKFCVRHWEKKSRRTSITVVDDSLCQQHNCNSPAERQVRKGDAWLYLCRKCMLPLVGLTPVVKSGAGASRKCDGCDVRFDTAYKKTPVYCNNCRYFQPPNRPSELSTSKPPVSKNSECRLCKCSFKADADELLCRACSRKRAREPIIDSGIPDSMQNARWSKIAAVEEPKSELDVMLGALKDKQAYDTVYAFYY